MIAAVRIRLTWRSGVSLPMVDPTSSHSNRESFPDCWDQNIQHARERDEDVEDTVQ